MVTGEFYSLLKFFERCFVLSFMHIRERQTEITFRKTAPVAGLSITVKRTM